MTQVILDALPGYDPRVIKRRPTDIVDIIGNSTGGPPGFPPVLNRPQRQNFTEQAFIPNTGQNDQLIKRTRMYVYRNANAIPAGIGAGNLSWVAAGPAKSIPTVRFNRNIRPIVGGGHRSMWGQHTNIDSGQKQGNQLAGRSRMKPAGTNRLTVQRYRGQSFSSTTQTVSQRKI
jgi:hypothetical protein